MYCNKIYRAGRDWSVSFFQNICKNYNLLYYEYVKFEVIIIIIIVIIIIIMSFYMAQNLRRTQCA